MIDTTGRFSAKEGDLFSGWTLMAEGVRQMAMSGNRVGVLNTNGLFSVKEGSVYSGWVDEAGGIQQAVLSE